MDWNEVSSVNWHGKKARWATSIILVWISSLMKAVSKPCISVLPEYFKWECFGGDHGHHLVKFMSFFPCLSSDVSPKVGCWRDITWTSAQLFYYTTHATVEGCNYETPQHLQSSLVVKPNTHFGFLWYSGGPYPVLLLAPWTTPQKLHGGFLLCSGSAATDCGDRYFCPLETLFHSYIATQSSWKSMKYQWATWKMAAAEVEENLWVSSNSLWNYETWWLLCTLILKVCEHITLPYRIGNGSSLRKDRGQMAPHPRVIEMFREFQHRDVWILI